jgi:hypothetical protein
VQDYAVLHAIWLAKLHRFCMLTKHAKLIFIETIDNHEVHRSEYRKKIKINYRKFFFGCSGKKKIFSTMKINFHVSEEKKFIFSNLCDENFFCRRFFFSERRKKYLIKKISMMRNFFSAAVIYR